MIKSKGLVFEYTQAEDSNDTFTALNGIDLHIQKGEFVAILGHNGSGKSTLAKHMNALLQPTEGTMLVKGYDTKNLDSLFDIRQTAGMVFQNPDNQLVATIVEEDIAFGPENLGLPPKTIRQRVDEALAQVGMSRYATQSPHFLSGGQKQRVAIAGILAMKPDCIILDEPTAMLDPIGRKEVLETVTRLNREEGITIVLITHYMDEAVQADRVVVMENGVIVMDDVPKKIFSQVERLKSLRLDVPQVTELCFQLRNLGMQVSEDIVTVEEMVKEMVGVMCQSK